MTQVVEVPGFGDVEFPDDMTDEQIATAIRANMSTQAPAATAPSVPIPSVGGAGGYNPMLSRLAGATQAGMGQLGMTPENVSNPIANAAGPLETLTQGVTGGVSLPLSGVAGIGQGVWNTLFPNNAGPQAGDRVRQVQEALTYQPRTGMGAGFSRTVNAVPEAYQAGTNYLGEKTTDITGSPALGTLVKTAGDIAPMVAGARSGAKGGPNPTGKYVSTKYEVPTTEALTSASKKAYSAAKDAGVIVPAEGYGKALGKVQTMVKEEGLDPTLHPKSLAVMKRLNEAEGKPLTLQEAETLRKIALDAEDDLNPVTRQPTPDARIAGKIVDELDDSIDALSVNSPARALWARSRRSQMVDRMIDRAEINAGAKYTQAGMETALRNEFKQLARNDRRMRGLTPAQQAAIKKVAKGGPLENTLRTLGKFDPFGSVVSAAGSLGTSAMLSPLTGGASALLPAAGFIGKRLATAATKRNVANAREALVGRGINDGLLAKGNTTPLAGESQGLLGSSVSSGMRGARPVERIRAEIQSLDAEVQRLSAAGPAGATVRQSVESELARLRRELAAAEAQGG